MPGFYQQTVWPTLYQLLELICSCNLPCIDQKNVPFKQQQNKYNQQPKSPKVACEFKFCCCYLSCAWGRQEFNFLPEKRETGPTPHPPGSPSSLCNFCQACHSATIIPTRAHLTDSVNGQLGPFIADPVMRISWLLYCVSYPARTSSHGSCPCPVQRLGLWFPCSGERWAAAYIWAAATVRNKCTKAVIQIIVPKVANRMEQSLSWPECS